MQGRPAYYNVCHVQETTQETQASAKKGDEKDVISSRPLNKKTQCRENSMCKRPLRRSHGETQSSCRPGETD
jgi:hypothetical protein